MWSPTHVQVTVQRARGLIVKGNHPAFVTIALGKEKYQTSAKDYGELEGCVVEWHEKCELKIPSQGNTAVITLTALTKNNFIGADQFLGCVTIPLAELDVYDRPKNKWYDLQDKRGKAKTKERGQLEVKISFSVLPEGGGGGEAAGKKEARKSTSHLANLGGSLASLSSVDKKSFKKLARSITSKIKAGKSGKDHHQHQLKTSSYEGGKSDPDPGVVSDDDEFPMDDLSHTGSGCSLNVSHVTSVSGSGSEVQETPLPVTKPPRSVTPIQEKFVHKWEQKYLEAKRGKKERIVVGGEKELVAGGGTSPEIRRKFGDRSREDLIDMVCDLQDRLYAVQKEKRDLENYLDMILLRVMETAPQVLQNPYRNY